MTTNLSHIAFEKLYDTYYRGQYGDFNVFIRLPDGYMNVTKFCSMAESQSGIPKKFSNWKRAISSNELIAAASRSTGIPVDQLMEVVQTGKHADVSGTYVHPLLVPHIASWASSDFAIKVSQIVNAAMERENQQKIRAQARALAEKDGTIAEKDDNIAKLMAMLQASNEQLNAKIESTTAQVTAQFNAATQDLKQDLKITHEQLGTVTQELQMNTEELKITHEQLGTVTQELQMNTEELKTTHQKLDNITEIVTDTHEGTADVKRKVDDLRHTFAPEQVAPQPTIPTKEQAMILTRVTPTMYKVTRCQIESKNRSLAKLARTEGHLEATSIYECNPCANPIKVGLRALEVLRAHPDVNVRYQTITLQNPNRFAEVDLVAIFAEAANHEAAAVRAHIADIKNDLTTIQHKLVV